VDVGAAAGAAKAPKLGVAESRLRVVQLAAKRIIYISPQKIFLNMHLKFPLPEQLLLSLSLFMSCVQGILKNLPEAEGAGVVPDEKPAISCGEARRKWSAAKRT
jgi:hypothetical protein